MCSGPRRSLRRSRNAAIILPTSALTQCARAPPLLRRKLLRPFSNKEGRSAPVTRATSLSSPRAVTRATSLSSPRARLRGQRRSLRRARSHAGNVALFAARGYAGNVALFAARSYAGNVAVFAARGYAGNVALFAALGRARSIASYAPPLHTLSVVARCTTFRRDASPVARGGFANPPWRTPLPHWAVRSSLSPVARGGLATPVARETGRHHWGSSRASLTVAHCTERPAPPKVIARPRAPALHWRVDDCPPPPRKNTLRSSR
jgi:hypothetical protein